MTPARVYKILEKCQKCGGRDYLIKGLCLGYRCGMKRKEKMKDREEKNDRGKEE